MDTISIFIVGEKNVKCQKNNLKKNHFNKSNDNNKSDPEYLQHPSTCAVCHNFPATAACLSSFLT